VVAGGTVKQPRIVTASDDAKAVATENKLATVFESTKARPKDKRKRERNDDPGDIEGYLGPWGKFVDEQRVAVPNDVGRKGKTRPNVPSNVPFSDSPPFLDQVVATSRRMLQQGGSNKSCRTLGILTLLSQ
jgi:hypothetical protein